MFGSVPDLKMYVQNWGSFPLKHKAPNSRFSVIKTVIERHPYTESLIDQFPCVCVYIWLLRPNHWTDLHKNYTSR